MDGLDGGVGLLWGVGVRVIDGVIWQGEGE